MGSTVLPMEEEGKHEIGLQIPAKVISPHLGKVLQLCGSWHYQNLPQPQTFSFEISFFSEVSEDISGSKIVS